MDLNQMQSSVFSYLSLVFQDYSLKRAFLSKTDKDRFLYLVDRQRYHELFMLMLEIAISYHGVSSVRIKTEQACIAHSPSLLKFDLPMRNQFTPIKELKPSQSAWNLKSPLTIQEMKQRILRLASRQECRSKSKLQSEISIKSFQTEQMPEPRDRTTFGNVGIQVNQDSIIEQKNDLHLSIKGAPTFTSIKEGRPKSPSEHQERLRFDQSYLSVDQIQKKRHSPTPVRQQFNILTNT